MSIVTGSLGPSRLEPTTASGGSRPPPYGGPRHEAALTSQAAAAAAAAASSRSGTAEVGQLTGGTPPAPVSDIMIKEVGSNWVSLCWKRPPVTNRGGTPILTYKVEKNEKNCLKSSAFFIRYF